MFYGSVSECEYGRIAANRDIMRLPSISRLVVFNFQFRNSDGYSYRQRLNLQTANLQPDLLVACFAMLCNPHSWDKGTDPVDVDLSWP